MAGLSAANTAEKLTRELDRLMAAAHKAGKPLTAAALRRAGLTADAAQLALLNGKPHAQRHPIPSAPSTFEELLASGSGFERVCEGLDPVDFNPPNGGMTPEADESCGTCPVRQKCLDYALDHPDEARGIWGGYGENERLGLRTSGIRGGNHKFMDGRTIADDSLPMMIGLKLREQLDKFNSFDAPIQNRELRPGDQPHAA